MYWCCSSYSGLLGDQFWDIYNKGLDLFIADISSLKGDVKLGGKQNTADAGIWNKNRKCWKISAGLTASVGREQSQRFEWRWPFVRALTKGHPDSKHWLYSLPTDAARPAESFWALVLQFKGWSKIKKKTLVDHPSGENESAVFVFEKLVVVGFSSIVPFSWRLMRFSGKTIDTDCNLTQLWDLVSLFTPWVQESAGKFQTFPPSLQPPHAPSTPPAPAAAHPLTPSWIIFITILGSVFVNLLSTFIQIDTSKTVKLINNSWR